MEVNNVTIKQVLSDFDKLIIRFMLKSQPKSLYLKGISTTGKVVGSINSTFDRFTLLAKSVDLSCTKGGKTMEISIALNSMEKDDYGEYFSICLASKLKAPHDYNKIPYPDAQSLFIFPNNLIIEEAKVYSVLANNFVDFDEDFPNEKLISNINIDSIIALKTNKKSIITLQPHRGNISIVLYKREPDFLDYVEMTQKNWGEKYGYKYKYTIE